MCVHAPGMVETGRERGGGGDGRARKPVIVERRGVLEGGGNGFEDEDDIVEAM